VPAGRCDRQPIATGTPWRMTRGTVGAHRALDRPPSRPRLTGPLTCPAQGAVASGTREPVPVRWTPTRTRPPAGAGKRPVGNLTRAVAPADGRSVAAETVERADRAARRAPPAGSGRAGPGAEAEAPRRSAPHNAASGALTC